MPPKKVTTSEVKDTTTKSKSKPVKPEVVVEDVEDDESDDDSDDESNDESDDESDEESDDESNDNKDQPETHENVKDTPKEAKEKLKKMTFDEIFAEIDTLIKQELSLDSEIKTVKESLESLEKNRNASKKSKNKLLSLLPKAYLDGCNKARKEKKKRTNSSKSGILNELPVPPILIKFLGIPETSLMRRPTVFSLLNNKFKELKLKQGQETIFDKKTAKVFGLQEGHKIEFKQHQTFLAKLYAEAGIKSEKKVTTEVVL
jgi:hypothetical protein